MEYILKLINLLIFPGFIFTMIMGNNDISGFHV